jgi:hypothetical protein
VLGKEATLPIITPEEPMTQAEDVLIYQGLIIHHIFGGIF